MRHANAAVIVKRCLLAALAALVLCGAVAPGAETMMLIPDSGAPPIEIDLKQAPLDNYLTLTDGDPVVVSGVVSPDRRKVIATSVQPAGG